MATPRKPWFIHVVVFIVKTHHTKSLGDLGVLKVQCNVTLRVIASKNNQSRGLNLADDYLRVP